MHFQLICNQKSCYCPTVTSLIQNGVRSSTNIIQMPSRLRETKNMNRDCFQTSFELIVTDSLGLGGNMKAKRGREELCDVAKFFFKTQLVSFTSHPVSTSLNHAGPRITDSLIESTE